MKRELGYVARLEYPVEVLNLYKYFNLSPPAEFAAAKFNSHWTSTNYTAAYQYYADLPEQILYNLIKET